MLLVSAIQQHESATCIHMSCPWWMFLPAAPPPQHQRGDGPHRALGQAPCAIQHLPISYLFTQVLCCAQSLSHVPLSVTPWTVAHQASLSMGFSRQEYWSGLPWPPPGDFSNLGIKPRSPTIQADSLLSEPPGKPKNTGMGSLSLLYGIFATQIRTEYFRGILNQLSYTWQCVCESQSPNPSYPLLFPHSTSTHLSLKDTAHPGTFIFLEKAHDTCTYMHQNTEVNKNKTPIFIIHLKNWIQLC